ncbi:P-loop NTPase family protein [Vibrio vulnificus]|nr:hypothetical protein [Vibrio vulnificus]
MKVLDIFNPKGGNGKSMCAINLVAAVELGKDVMIIWQDPQGTSMLYGKGGKLPYEVQARYLKKSQMLMSSFLIILLVTFGMSLKVFYWSCHSKPHRDQYLTFIDACRRAKCLEKTLLLSLLMPSYTAKMESSQQS